MMTEENRTDRHKLSQFYKGKGFEIPYNNIQQFDDVNLNSENVSIGSLSFMYHTLKSKDKTLVKEKWILIFPKLDKIKRLVIKFGIDQELFNSLCKIPNLEELFIHSSKINDISQLIQIRDLKRLDIENFTTLSDISILEKIELKQLKIENCFKIENYEVIGKINSLIGLSLNGYCWGPKNLKIESIKTFANLKNLKHLDLTTTSLIDKNSINSILEIETLERFDFSGNVRPEIVENIKLKHPNLKAGFFVDWDYKNKKIYEGKYW